jgi:hypothetical protein
MLSCVEPAKYWHCVLAVVRLPAAGPENVKFCATVPDAVDGLAGAVEGAAEAGAAETTGDGLGSEVAAQPDKDSASTRTTAGLITR